jgi:hypothetical protein
MDSNSRSISIPVKTLYTKYELNQFGTQDILVYIDKSIIIGQNNLQALVENNYGRITIHGEEFIKTLNLLLTDKNLSDNNIKTIFNTNSNNSLQGYILN